MTTLLIADDMELNRMCLGLLFRRQGYRVLEADDGDQALRVTRAERPDVALVDLFMPEMDGFEYARHVRSDTAIAYLPIIFVSSTFSSDAAAVLSRLLSVRHTLQKSSTDEQFLEAVRDAAGSPVSPSVVAAGAEEFNREHARLISGKLTKHLGKAVATLGEFLGGNGQHGEATDRRLSSDPRPS